MMDGLRLNLCLILQISAFCYNDAAVRFANYYASHMVLQKAPAQAHIWGTGGAVGQSVTVVIDGKTVGTPMANGAGVWEILLPATPAGGPHNISVTSNGTTVTLSDVLFGDVWICSGQSNMGYQISQIRNYSSVVTSAMQRPNLRISELRQNALNATVKEPLIGTPWQKPGHDNTTHSFSAVCLMFAIELSQHVTQPLGMVETDWGGTPVEAWSSPTALAACPQHKKKRAIDPHLPSVLYNGMIAPILPMTIFGAIWYQGESNAGKPQLYACQIEAMISDWRAKFHQASKNQTSNTFPFGFVQLAPNRNVTGAHTGFPDLRWAQTAEYGYVPNPTLKNVFMAVAMDLPDYASPYGTIHPRTKEDVAVRLALAARGVAYGQQNIDFKGPFPTHFSQTGQKLTVEYDNGNTDISVRTTAGFEVCCGLSESHVCPGNGWTAAPISGHSATSVTLDTSGCQGHSHVVAGVRYAWEESPCDFKKCAVYGLGTNLPAPPFVKQAPFS
ncbi:sialate O-acetylesterase-like [Dreissena polymorpha]|uniref:Sialate O-acetylesterase domain-containing protein n=1 Tax=Dreissena polymorpha TaxID=45954 RepID=A0A9D4S2M0_DREPO|nr:sialate O-acetylesterase-like [Dreissena polymorpha]KAH3888285.1 hypothetical protein DPMN_012317 [Dreissena polymorpha]